MNFAYPQLWEEQQYYGNTMPEDRQAFRLSISVPEIDPRLTGKGFDCPFNGMSSYLVEQDQPYSHQLAGDFMMNGTTAWAAYNEDHTCDPSSPEGSDLSSMFDNDGFIQPPPPTRMLSRASSAHFNEPMSFTTFNSRSSTIIDAQLAGPAYQGSGFGYPPPSTSTLSHIQGTPDVELFKNEEDQYDMLDIKQDNNVNQLMMGQRPSYNPQYQNFSTDMTLDNSPAAPTPNTTLKSEDETDDQSASEQEYEAQENDSDTEWKPRSNVRHSSRRSMPRRNTVSNILHQSKVTKSPIQRRKSSNSTSNFVTAAVSKEHRHPCVFAFAGCTSLWKSKNEWKRHAMTQHLVLESYCCRLCKRDDSTTANGGSASASHAKGKAKLGKNTAWMMVDGQVGQVFNRKDLFTQHVKRMHEATFTKKCGGKSGNQGRDKKAFDDWIKAQQEGARFNTGRVALDNSYCPKDGCGMKFEGKKGWDDRLEHIWKHLDVEGTCDFDIGGGGMREWAQNSHIVVNYGDQLVLKDHVVEDTASDADAPGDDEYSGLLDGHR